MKVKQIASHRNGISGEGFYAVTFEDKDASKNMIAVVFDTPKHVAVLDVEKAAAGDIGFGTNSWRGDNFEPELRKAIRRYERQRRQSKS